MAESLNTWPRVHSCLYNWCPQQREECARCDAVCSVILSASGGRDCAARNDEETIGSLGTKRGSTRTS